jgi:hypothetical protein
VAFHTGDVIGDACPASPAARHVPVHSSNRIDDRVEFPDRQSLAMRLGLATLGVGGGAMMGVMAPEISGPSGATLGLAGLAFIGGLLSTWSPCGYSSLSLLRPQGAYSARSTLAWLPTLAMHALGYAAGGLILGGLLGALALVVPTSGTVGLVLLGLMALGYGLHQLGLFRMPYPQRRAQVPHDARARFRLPVVSLLYGFSLGLNFLTYVRTPILYIVVAGALLGGSVTNALILFGALNLGRFLPLVVNAFPVQDWTVQRWLASTETRAVAFDGLILTITGAAFMALIAM